MDYPIIKLAFNMLYVIIFTCLSLYKQTKLSLWDSNFKQLINICVVVFVSEQTTNQLCCK